MGFRPLKRWDRLTREQIRSWQGRTLHRFLTTKLAPFSPHYRAVFEREGIDADGVRSLEDLARLPFTTKSEIVPSEENPDGPRSFILQPTPELVREHLPKRDLLALLAKKAARGADFVKKQFTSEFNPVQMFFTTGRSASSLPFFLTQYDVAVLEETGRRIVETLDMRPAEDKVVSLFPYAPHLAFWQVNACGAGGGILTLSTGGGRAMGGDRILDILSRMKPTSVCGMPGYFYHILRRARDEGVDLSSVNRVALGGENVSHTLKAKIVEILKDMGSAEPRVASVYGFTEARQCWSECFEAPDTGFHTYPDLCIIEMIDPDSGEVVPEGETGELVFTTLDGRGSAMLRYRTGDIVEGGMTYEACPGCGRVVPRVGSQIRRVSNVKTLDITKVKGTLVNFNALTEMLGSDADIEEWQVVIKKVNDDPHEVDEFVLYGALRGGATASEVEARLQRDVRALTEVCFNQITFVPLEEMLERVGMEVNMKEERILDARAETRTV